MAVTRSFLKGMGLTDEQVSAIIDEHTNTVNGLKDARDSYKAEAEKVPALQAELNSLKANNSDDWKSKYDTLKQTFDDYKTEAASKAKAEKVKAAYTQLLKDANVDGKRIEAILKITDLSDKQLDDAGKLVDADKLSESIKTEWSAFIQTTGTKGAEVETPPPGGSGSAFAGMSLADKMRYANEHPNDQSVANWLSGTTKGA